MGQKKKAVLIISFCIRTPILPELAIDYDRGDI